MTRRQNNTASNYESFPSRIVLLTNKVVLFEGTKLKKKSILVMAEMILACFRYVQLPHL